MIIGHFRWLFSFTGEKKNPVNGKFHIFFYQNFNIIFPTICFSEYLF
jgi:hypothetical protein